ncbi:MAG: hypothetical protein QM674_08825 [Burkholderiaceae bacterium]
MGTSNHVAETIEGERAADFALAAIQGQAADPNLLARAFANLLAADGSLITPSLRRKGFARRLRKTIERSAPMPEQIVSIVSRGGGHGVF